MKALVVDRYADDLSRVECTEVEAPQLRRGQVLVRMLASAINPSDFNVIHGRYADALQHALWNHQRPSLYQLPFGKPLKRPPCTLGNEGVGIVEEVGGGLLARRLRGKRVAVMAGDNADSGTWAEYIAVDATRAVPLPGDIGDDQGAMFFINPLAAYILTRELLRIPRGEYLLQTAANSSLGKMVIRLGKRFGFKTINLVRREERVAELKRLGADVVICTRNREPFDEVARVTRGLGVRYAIDCVAGESTVQLMRCMAPGGRLVIYGTLSQAPVPLPPRELMMSLARVEGFFLGNWLAQQSKWKQLSLLNEVRKLIATGELSAQVERKFALQDYEAAFAFARSGAGKALFRMGDNL